MSDYRGVLTSVIGALSGALVVGLACMWLTYLLLRVDSWNNAQLAGIAAATTLGAGLGAWLALGLRSKSKRGLTGIIIGVVTPVAAVFVLLIVQPLLQEMIPGPPDYYDRSDELFAIVVAVAITAAVVRLALTFGEPRQSSQ